VDPEDFTGREAEVIDILRSGPKPATEVLKKLGLLDQSQLDIQGLWREEVIGKSGFTPTDLLHTDGRHTPWDVPASQAALTVFSNYLTWDEEGFSEFLWSKMTEIIVHSVISFLTEKDIPDLQDPRHALARWFLGESIQPSHDHLETRVRLKHPLIGIGAPAEVMLKDAAAVLGTDLILPEHYQVANAAGAVAGSVMVSEETLIYPHLSAGNVDVVGYFVQSREDRVEYEELEDALDHARGAVAERARSAALRSGADNPQVVIDVVQDGMDSYRIKARAVGKPRLEHQE
jgi:N-methylhydantoinase A/oxoprolinase/acetone carboxylase beta subunit